MLRSRRLTQSLAQQPQLTPQEAVETLPIPLLNGGIRTDRAPIDLADNECVAQEGLHVVAGRLVVDNGYSPLGEEYIGISQKTLQVFMEDGAAPLLNITTRTVYEYNEDVNQWQLVAWMQKNEITTTPLVATDTTVNVDDVTGIAVGNYIGIALDDGTQHIAEVTNIAALVVTFDPAIPTGGTAAIGNIVAGSVPLDGDPAFSQVSWTPFPPLNLIIFCNGVDVVMKYETGVVNELGGFTDPTSCRAMAVFHECLLIANLIEGGDSKPFRVKMSDQADPEGWDVGVDGIAAIYDLLDTDDDIFAMKLLGPWLFAYRDRTIMRASYVGAFNETLFWEYMVTDDGIQSQGSVVEVANVHYLVGHVNVWRYAGGYQLDPVGDAIYENFLSESGDLTAPARATIFMVYVPPLREVWVFYPRTQGADVSEVPNRMLRLALDTGGWTPRTFADPMYGAGEYNAVLNGVAWEDALGIWTDPQWERPWGTRTLISNVPVILLSSSEEGGRVLAYDYAAVDDNGTTIEWSLTTKQYGSDQMFSRWGPLSLLAQGRDIVVEFSRNEGSSWRTLIDDLDFGGLVNAVTPRVRRVYVDESSTRAQFRISGTDPLFQLRRGSLDREDDTLW